MAEKVKNMEEAFAALDEIIEQLETGEGSLEEAFQNYQKGMVLLKECSSQLDLVEKKMQQLNEKGELSEF
ncbi:MAG: exodeoxyribonuclease VII small subunit [Oliverpabstia sp.]